MKYRTAAVLIFAGISISPASAQYSTECRNKPFGLGVECTTTAPRPQENGWDRINKQIEQLRLSNEADKKAKRDEELYQLRLKEIEARRLEQMQLAQQQEQLRLQAEQVFRVQQEEERRRLLLEELNKSVSTAVLEHRCEDAKNIALQAGQLDLAERAVRLCTPAPRSKIQTKKGSSNSAGSINAGPARGKGQLPRGSISQNVDLQKSTAGSTTFSPSPVRIPSGLPVSQSQLVSVRRIAAGVAIKTTPDATVIATADGTVRFSGPMQGLGAAVVVSHGGNLETVYANLETITVIQNSIVKKGQALGYVVSNSSKPASDLIYQVKVAGAQVNPAPYLNESKATEAAAAGDRASNFRQGAAAQTFAAQPAAPTNRPLDHKAKWAAAQEGRGYDCIGKNVEAIQSYRKALLNGRNDDVTRSLAISLAISGDAKGMIGTIRPLLLEGDRTSQFTYSVALALLGRTDEAITAAKRVAPVVLVDAIAVYFRYMDRLTPSQKAYAAHFGLFPKAKDIGRDGAPFPGEFDQDFARIYQRLMDGSY